MSITDKVVKNIKYLRYDLENDHKYQEEIIDALYKFDPKLHISDFENFKCPFQLSQVNVKNHYIKYAYRKLFLVYDCITNTFYDITDSTDSWVKPLYIYTHSPYLLM
jgi:hypothetical protein